MLDSDLEAQILHLERSIATLRAEKALVQKRLEAYKYPVLTLPNEITSDIFIHSLPIYPEAPPLIGLASPTSLTHVCRRWREVALATPALWKAIEFNSYSTPAKHIGHIADAWIKRSGSCLLSVRISIHNLDVLDKIFTELSDMAITRWEHLVLWVPSSFLPKISGPMPSLRSLDFGSHSASSNDPFTFADMPQLCTVVLCRRANVNLPWIQLTCLTFNCVNVGECVRILTQTPNLVQCILILSDLYGPIGVATSDLLLPRLKSLVLETEFPQTEVGDDFILSFVVPSISTLILEERYLGKDYIPTLASFISKSGCRLQEVWITESTSSTTDQKLYRSAFPSIPTFSFNPLYEKTSDEDGSED